MIVGIIFYNTIPIFSETIMLLMESAPNDLCSHASTSHELQELIKEQQGVVDVHELHVWRLAQDVNICSMHVIVDELHSSDLKLLWKLQDDIKHLLHECSIHASSLQFEPMRSKQSNSEFNCVDPVCDDKDVCMRNWYISRSQIVSS
uniref:Cation efflux protein cytoplasmic domain-containing protein n=2 Tax=Guillardia theta TaxID=55529 RepID=A0A6U6BST0_GUITH|mmetsp:Transcript_41412/g.130370  ORF Transcript_41412/g.130370 Transcript_41412/m.130370 type:complete len:147 (+) Transcript_41412:699-1139(+)